MADAATHTALAWVGGRALDARARAVFLVGTLLPDLLYKACLYLFNASTWFCEPTHSPLVVLVVAYAGALLFRESFRRAAFVALWMGSWLHLAVDAGKSYMGEGVILWAYPFSMDRFELGLYRDYETIYFIIPAVVLAGLVELMCRFKRAR